MLPYALVIGGGRIFREAATKKVSRPAAGRPDESGPQAQACPTRCPAMCA